MNIRTPRSQADVIARAEMAGKAIRLYNQFIAMHNTGRANPHRLASIAEVHADFVCGVRTEKQAEEMNDILAEYGITA